jgi:transposase
MRRLRQLSPEVLMPRFVQGSDRDQVTLLPECLDDYIAEDNPVRAVDAFVEELELEALGPCEGERSNTCLAR